MATFNIGSAPARNYDHYGAGSSGAAHKRAGQKKRKHSTSPAKATAPKIPQIFGGATPLRFLDLAGAPDGLATRIKRYGGAMAGDVGQADYILLRTPPGQTRNETFISVIKGERHSRSRKPDSCVISVEYIDQCIDAGRLLDCSPYFVTIGPDLPRASAAPMTPRVPTSPPQDAHKRLRPPTPDWHHSESATLQPPSPSIPRPPTPPQTAEPTLGDSLEPTLSSTLEPILDYENGLIDLDYQEGDEMMVDLDVHLDVPTRHDWSEIPQIELPPTVLGTHAAAVRILIFELTLWDGEGTKAECLQRIQNKVSGSSR